MSTAQTESTKGKKSTKASTKKAAAPAKTKKSASAGKKDGGGRAAKFDYGKKLTVVSKDHGYREGSEREKLFKLMKTGQTVEKYLEAGGSTRALERAIEAKLVKVS